MTARPGPVVVFGAYGHTGRFVVAELARRGRATVVSGRDEARLRQLEAGDHSLTVRPASIDDTTSLDRALAGSAAVINCAGPFLDTAVALAGAACRAGVHYLDVTAEQRAVMAIFEQFGAAARAAGIVMVPAMAFYGGLSDLLATAAMKGWDLADRIEVAVALDSWMPTRGTRLTGERNTGSRLAYVGHRLQPMANPPATRSWEFPAPFGAQEVRAVPLTETILIPSHLRTAEVASYINARPLADLHDPSTPAPTAADTSGRSAQQFLVDVVVHRGADRRRAIARGRDIYAVTAPIVVEAVERILAGRCTGTGAAAPGALFEAAGFLAALVPDHLIVELP